MDKIKPINPTEKVLMSKRPFENENIKSKKNEKRTLSFEECLKEAIEENNKNKWYLDLIVWLFIFYN